ncbi:MAG: acyl-CoA thioesterase, partial [Bdellovibrionales bacterium]|nr:acyl-CoA thioesterase [Bdellovibrionales bacterium]
FDYSLTIQEVDLDSFGHLNNAVYLRLFEQARWQFIAERGFGLREIQEKGVGPVILDLSIRFVKELRARDEIKIRSQAVSFSGKIGKIKQWMERDGICVCEAIFTIGFWNIHQRKLIPATPEWRNAIGL